MDALPLVDTHCHLADPRLRDDTGEIITRARQAGTRFLISVGAIGSIECDRMTVAIAERNPCVYAAIGVHPHDAKDFDDNRMAQLRELAASPKVVAIGESGLDFHYLHSPAEAQENALRRHLELAASLELPIVIHCREAEARLAAIVRETGLPHRGGAIHSFTGDSRAAEVFLALGFHISFSGIVTFKNARALREAALIVPTDRLLIETDAPYLAPEPYRGKRNEPAFVARTLETLAQLRSADVSLLGETIIANASRLFHINS
ncbi:MAG TPA: TatD family hydrolase [Candidatus Binataceae bacterium]|nr:TatD family hydrolase [Candidatus Binataceae bacterium]